MTVDAPSLTALTWVKARKSQGMGMCVEVTAASGVIRVRDSKHPDGPVLSFSRGEFDAFVDGCRRGEFDAFLE